MFTRNFQLKPYNTFGLPCITSEYFSFSTEEQLVEFIKSGSAVNKKVLVLGGGSNILFTRDFDGLVLHPEIPGITLEKITDDYAEVSVGAGTVWDDFVEWTVEHGFYGIENLSLIPGLSGAAPVQNIGAYGVEAKDTIIKIRMVMLSDSSAIEINGSDCRFGYRDSIFKHELKNKTIVTRVWFRLSVKPVLNVTYGDIATEVEGLGEMNLRNVRQAVINIRRRKLPDPSVTGNAGSFFKNPVVTQGNFSELLSQYPDMPHYDLPDGTVKLAAGWLIDRCGWKGKRIGNAGLHPKQALVLVNYGDATGKEIASLGEEISASVKDAFGIDLFHEVEII
jgi:UDP-N-acetylmuramate dehydrogenase